MWQQLAELLQVLNEQPDTVLSDVSERALKACVRTGTCNNVSLAMVCSGLRCSFCGEVIGSRWFSISHALRRDQWIECDECGEKNSGWSEEKYNSLPEEDKAFMESMSGKYVGEMTEEEQDRLGKLEDQCYEFDFPENIEEEMAEIDRWQKEDEKIVYPDGRYRKAHWEELLKLRGVPLIPPQLAKV